MIDTFTTMNDGTESMISRICVALRRRETSTYSYVSRRLMLSYLLLEILFLIVQGLDDFSLKNFRIGPMAHDAGKCTPTSYARAIIFIDRNSSAWPLAMVVFRFK